MFLRRRSADQHDQAGERARGDEQQAEAEDDRIAVGAARGGRKTRWTKVIEHSTGARRSRTSSSRSRIAATLASRAPIAREAVPDGLAEAPPAPARG